MGSHSYLVNLNSPIHFNQAIATAIEARADKADSLADARINTLARLTDAQKTKLIAATDAIDTKIHTFVDAHTDAALMEMPLSVHFTKAQAAAMEARADKVESTAEAKVNASTKLSDAQKAKLIAALKLEDSNLHKFVDAHTTAAQLQEMYCALTHLGDCFWA